MCQFISGWINQEGEILIRDFRSHSGTERALGRSLEREGYRPWEWTRDDSGESLTVRIVPNEEWNEAAYKSLILSRYQSRGDLGYSVVNTKEFRDYIKN
jgi:hypothetical protein